MALNSQAAPPTAADKRALRALLALIVATVSVLAFASSSAFATGTNGPNHGTIKIDDTALLEGDKQRPDGPDNEPKPVGCVFRIDFYNFPSDTPTALISFENKSPGKGTYEPVTETDLKGPRSVTFATSDGPGSVKEYTAATYTVVPGGELEALPNGQILIKVTVELEGDNNFRKHKVLKVECEPVTPSPSPSATVTTSPSASPTASATPTVSVTPSPTESVTSSPSPSVTTSPSPTTVVNNTQTTIINTTNTTVNTTNTTINTTNTTTTVPPVVVMGPPTGVITLPVPTQVTPPAVALPIGAVTVDVPATLPEAAPVALLPEVAQAPAPAVIPAGRPAATQPRTLPFTGSAVDVLLMTGLALVLGGAGMLLLTARRPRTAGI